MSHLSTRLYRVLLTSSGVVGEPESSRERLGELASRRRRELGLSVSAAARAAHIDRATWAGMERSGRRTEAYNYAGIERALAWEPGSVDQILAGGEPTPVSRRPATQEPIPDLDLDVEIERIAALDLPARTRLVLLRKLIDLHEQAQAEQHEQQQNPTTYRDKEAG